MKIEVFVCRRLELEQDTVLAILRLKGLELGFAENDRFFLNQNEAATDARNLLALKEHDVGVGAIENRTDCDAQLIAGGEWTRTLTDTWDSGQGTKVGARKMLIADLIPRQNSPRCLLRIDEGRRCVDHAGSQSAGGADSKEPVEVGEIALSKQEARRIVLDHLPGPLKGILELFLSRCRDNDDVKLSAGRLELVRPDHRSAVTASALDLPPIAVHLTTVDDEDVDESSL